MIYCFNFRPNSEARARICKPPFKVPRIRFPAWRPSATTLFIVQRPAKPHRLAESIPVLLRRLQIRALLLKYLLSFSSSNLRCFRKQPSKDDIIFSSLFWSPEEKVMVFFPLCNKQWRNGEVPQLMEMDECTVWMHETEKDKWNKKSGSSHQTF